MSESLTLPIDTALQALKHLLLLVVIGSLHRRHRTAEDKERQLRLGRVLFSTSPSPSVQDISVEAPKVQPFLEILDRQLHAHDEELYRPLLEGCGFSTQGNTTSTLIRLMELLLKFVREAKENQMGEISVNVILEKICAENSIHVDGKDLPFTVKQALLSLLGFMTRLCKITLPVSPTILSLSEPTDPTIPSPTRKIKDTKGPIEDLVCGMSGFTPVPTEQVKPKRISPRPPKPPEKTSPAIQATNHRSLFAETLLSYRLLVDQEERSRRLFNNKEIKYASFHGITDQLLIDLCGKAPCLPNLIDDQSVTEQAFYNSVWDFPHYGERLTDLEKYIKAKKPHTIVDLWYDRRDTSQWVLTWVVLMFTAATIVIGIVQIAIGAAQVHLARFPPMHPG
ncbi:MAG: hypothetical protein Q9218_002564 [Villophora microphyllina]